MRDKKLKDKDLTAYCGLYCGDCIRFNCRASDLSVLLLDELERSHFHEFSKVKRSRAKELDHYESMITALKTISAIKCEVPCRLGGDGCNGTCQVSICVKDKAIEGCWDCTEFEACNKLDFLKPFHGDTPIKNLRNIRKSGIDSWAKYREKCYPWL